MLGHFPSQRLMVLRWIAADYPSYSRGKEINARPSSIRSAQDIGGLRGGVAEQHF
jgi:hypothetical protein